MKFLEVIRWWVYALLTCVPLAPAWARPLKIAVPDGPVSLPLYVAFDKRFFDEEGLDVVRAWCTSGRACVAMLRDGVVDLAASAEFAVATSGAQKSEIAILATLGESSRQIKLIGSRDAGIVNAADVAGKRVATVAGTSAQYFLDQWLVFQSINPQAIDLKAMDSGELLSAVRRRLVDAVAIWEPEATRVVDALGKSAVRLPSAHVYTQHFCLIASRQALAQRRESFEKLLRALARAQRFISESRIEARGILASRLGVPSAMAEKLISENDFKLALHATLPATMVTQVRWQMAQRRESRGARIGSPAELIDPSVLLSVLPQGVTMPR